eukprot:scaffold825_cov249-Pinguiococcus_pyrenoidosus.AAC.21
MPPQPPSPSKAASPVPSLGEARRPRRFAKAPTPERSLPSAYMPRKTFAFGSARKPRKNRRPLTRSAPPPATTTKVWRFLLCASDLPSMNTTESLKMSSDIISASSVAGATSNGMLLVDTVAFSGSRGSGNLIRKPPATWFVRCVTSIAAVAPARDV